MNSQHQTHRNYAPTLVMTLWLVGVFGLVLGSWSINNYPIDFLAYRRAADSFLATGNPYGTPQQAQSAWSAYHELEGRMKKAFTDGRGVQTLIEISTAPQTPGPYLYLPTLAELIARLNIHPLVFTIVVLLSLAVFITVWLRTLGVSRWWIWLAILPGEMSASAHGGNIELILMCLCLLGGALLYSERPYWAAPLAAIAFLIKPFYGAPFLAMGLIRALNQPVARRRLAGTLGLTIALLSVEVFRWGPMLRGHVFEFLSHADELAWFTMPVEQQTPMSSWNRTQFQALIGWGVSAAAARAVVFVSGTLLFLAMLFHARRERPTFAQSFVLSMALLYWVRPISWGLNGVEFLLVPMLSLSLRGLQLRALYVGTFLLVLSRWVAMGLQLAGAGLPLTTLQTARFPFETYFLLPCIVWLSFVAARKKEPFENLKREPTLIV